MFAVAVRAANPGEAGARDCHSLLLACVRPDGTAVDYSPSNVPYKPKVWNRVSLEGFNDGDFTFVMGYPGRTYHNYALSELRADQ